MEDENDNEEIEIDSTKSEKKRILDKIINKSVLCSKATINFVTKIIEALMSMNKEKLILLSENGLPDDLPELRSLIWKIYFDYLPLDSRNWDTFLISKRTAYKKYRISIFQKLEKELKLLEGYNNMTSEQKKEMDKNTHKIILEEICKDTNRTHTEMNFFVKPIDENNTFTEKEILELVQDKRNCTLKNINFTYKINIVLTHADVISRILFIYSKFEPEVSYVQGMNEIIAPIYYAFSFDRINDSEPIDDIEADAFWCFYNLMCIFRELFNKKEDKNEHGISAKTERLKKMLKIVDKNLYEYLINIKFDFSLLTFKWISLMFSQDFFMIDLLRIWDFLLSSDNKYQNCYYFSLSIILMRKDFIMKNNIYKIYENFQNLKDLDVDNIIFNAKYIKNKCGKKCNEIMKEED